MKKTKRFRKIAKVYFLLFIMSIYIASAGQDQGKPQDRENTRQGKVMSKPGLAYEGLGWA
jgi:hypothetical protein